MSHSHMMQGTESVQLNSRSPRAFNGRFATDAQGNDPIGKPDYSEPILSKNRYGREDILSLYRSAPAPQGVLDCRFYVEEPLTPAILSPQTEAEIKAHSNMNSSKAVNNLHRDHHLHNGGSSIGISGGQSPFSPSWAQRGGRSGFSRGGGTTGINTRAQALFDPKDPKDRPRNRVRSTSEDDPVTAGNGWVQVTKTPKAYTPTSRTSTTTNAEAPATPRNLQTSWRRHDSQSGGSPPHTPGAEDGKPREPEWANDESDWPDTSTGGNHGSFDDDGNFRTSQSRSDSLIHGAAYETVNAWDQKRGLGGDDQLMEALRRLNPAGIEPVVPQIPPKLMTQTSVPVPEPQWFYCDPNGEVHGPFAKANMQGWFNSGYFSGTLKVRRDCDANFTTLAELCRLYGETTPFNVVKAPTPPVAPSTSPWTIGTGRLGATSTAVQDPHMQAELLRIEEENRRLAEESRKLMAMQQSILSEKEQFQEKERAIRELEEQVMRQKEEFRRMRDEQAERERQKELELQNELARIRKIEMEKEVLLKQKEQELLLKEELSRQKAATEAANRRHEELLEQKRLQEEERRNWELQKSQFETCRKKEAKLKEKAEEEMKKKREEEVKRMQEEELERQRHLEQLRVRDSKVVVTEKVTLPVSTSPTGPVHVEKANDSKSANKAAPWIARAMDTVESSSDARTLRQIQLEEERKVREQQKLEKERQEAQKKLQPVEPSATWSNSSQRINWGSTGAPAPAWGGAGVNTSQPSANSMFDGPTLSRPQPKAKVAAEAAAAAAKAKVTAQAKAAQVKKESGKKSSPKDDSLSKWIIQRVRKLDSSVEADVFAHFIGDVQSPNEVEDYMFSYFGESNATKEFCKEFLLRRSDLRSKNKSADRDDLSRPAHAQGPSIAAPAAPTTAVTVGKKKKKGKGIKMIVDGASLGFRPTGDPNRVNAGEIDVIGGSEW